MNPFDNLRPMPPSPCGCVPRPWPRPVVPVPVTPQMQPHWAEELRRILDGKQDAISDLDDIREGAQAGATAYQKPEDGVPKSDLAADVQASLDNADTAVQPAAIAGFVDGAEYDADYGDPPKPSILLKHGDEVVATVDAADFVIDGMVSNVEVKNGYLVITFNTDSGKQPISIPLTDIFDPDNYYDKTAADGKFVAKEVGKGLSTEDYTTAEKTKLDGIAAGAQVNVIETVKVNGTALTPQGKAVNIPVPTLDDAVTRTSANGVKSSGIWSALWGALSALPTGFSSLYDWAVAQLAGKLGKSGGTMTGPLTMDKSVVELKDSTGYKRVLRCTGTGGDFYIDYYDSQGTLLYSLIVPSIGGTLALTAGTGHNGHLAALDANGNPTDSTIPAANVAVKGEIPYILVTKTIDNGAVTLDDRAINAVAVSSSLASLTVNFPTATSGKVRDFGLRLTVASGITTAPQLVLPQGVTCENADGAAPEIGADGAATILYFTETAANVFLVKGEVVTAIS